MRILVTGGAGKLGSLVVHALVNHGHSVHVFDLPQVNYSALTNVPDITIFKGDILDRQQIQAACDGVDVAIHLAAILPPYSEQNPQKTLQVNVQGTEQLTKALLATSHGHLVFSSSVSVYGRTQHETQPISIDHIRQASDTYAKSKIMAENVVHHSRLTHTTLRISGIYAAVPFEFPSPVQFKADQRVEFIAREDVVAAILIAIEHNAQNHIFNIAGGTTWQMTGRTFVKGIYAGFGVPGEADYPTEYGYFDWYDTKAAQHILNYQKTSFNQFLTKLGEIFS
jgi:nucleoside-diphosphate-sugar epimerase